MFVTCYLDMPNSSLSILDFLIEYVVVQATKQTARIDTIKLVLLQLLVTYNTVYLWLTMRTVRSCFEFSKQLLCLNISCYSKSASYSILCPSTKKSDSMVGSEEGLFVFIFINSDEPGSKCFSDSCERTPPTAT